jgi:DNA-binding transcriptional MerR regulator/methylmalonyl-CoA mutase cobalamin-binding subunit
MYTIKQAAMRSGVDASLIRAWERRYGVTRPERTPGGYRLYSDEEIARLRAMRELIESGWSAAQAATAAATQQPTTTAREVPSPASSPGVPDLVAAAARYDLAAVEDALDGLFGRGSFEAVIDDFVLPAVARLGQAWEDGTIDVAAEHLASSAVLRRLSALFDMAGVAGGGRGVLVGLPPGSRHELGALAFAVALRRRGADVIYVGSDVPAASWVAAAAESGAQAAVIGVVTDADVTPAVQVAEALRAARPDLVLAIGGASATSPPVEGATVLPARVVDAAGAIRGRLR